MGNKIRLMVIQLQSSYHVSEVNKSLDAGKFLHFSFLSIHKYFGLSVCQSKTWCFNCSIIISWHLFDVTSYWQPIAMRTQFCQSKHFVLWYKKFQLCSGKNTDRKKGYSESRSWTWHESYKKKVDKIIILLFENVPLSICVWLSLSVGVRSDAFLTLIGIEANTIANTKLFNNFETTLIDIPEHS